MLYKKCSENYLVWSSGISRVVSDDSVAGKRICVFCRYGSLESQETALLDTGSEWSVVGGDFAEVLQETGDLGQPVEPIKIHTRFGSLEGSLFRCPVRLLADDLGGTDLQVDATVAVLPEWKGPNVLGYRGFLERIRIAIDPGAQGDEEIIFFGTPV
jgi:hypothetical protein